MMMANYLPTVLEGSARSWLLNLPVGSIYTWEQLCDTLIANFQGTYDCPGKEDDLHRMKQKTNYCRWLGNVWIWVKKEIPVWTGLEHCGLRVAFVCHRSRKLKMIS